MSQPSVETLSKCDKCGDDYNIKTLDKYLKKYIIINASTDDTSVSAIKSQLKMRICGACRIKDAPCMGCSECRRRTPLNEPCLSCIYYGFNHPMNANGKCLICG